MAIDCELDIGCDDGEMIQLYKVEIVAMDRGGVKCCECGRVITQGQNYELATGEFDGAPYKAETCMDCREIAEGLSESSRAHGALWESMESFGFESLTTGCFSRVRTASARSLLRKRWRQWKGLAK